MKEGEETGEASAAPDARLPLGERRGLAPGALHVYTGADGT